MNRFNYLVFGAGRQGVAAVYDLAHRCEAAHITLVDPDGEARDRAKRRLAGIGLGDVRMLYLPHANTEIVQEHDIALGCAPYSCNMDFTKMCLKAGVPFCDLGGNPNMVTEQEEYLKGITDKILVVPDCGISPGISNVIVMEAAREGAKDITVRCGGMPLRKPDVVENPLGYQIVFDPQGLVSEYSGDVPSIVDSKMEMVAARSVVEEFDSRHECSPTSNNSTQVVKYFLEKGIRNYNYMTIRYKGHFKTFASFFRGVPEKNIIDYLNSTPCLQYDPSVDRDKLILEISATNRDKPIIETHKWRFDIEACPRTKFTAMELGTSWGITTVAYYLAQNHQVMQEYIEDFGCFATPERIIPGSWLIKELNERLAQ